LLQEFRRNHVAQPRGIVGSKFLKISYCPEHTPVMLVGKYLQLHNI